MGSATAGFDPQEDLRYVFMHELRIIGSNSMRRDDLERLLQLCAAGRLHPAIDRVFELDDAWKNSVAAMPPYRHTSDRVANKFCSSSPNRSLR